MKKVVLVLMLILISFVSEAKVKGYNIDKKEVIKLVVESNKIVFEDENQDKWNEILLGTLAAETDLGAFRRGSKHGIAQITPIAYKFIKERLAKDKETYEKLKENGLDFKKISFNDLTDNHKASIVAMSLYYKYVIKMKKGNINGKSPAEVWKKYYNTYAGAGTLSHFNKAYARNEEIINVAMNEIRIDEFRDTMFVKEVKLVEGKLVMINNNKLDTIENSQLTLTQLIDDMNVIELHAIMGLDGKLETGVSYLIE